MISMSVNKYRKGGMTKRNGSYTFVLVMLQLPAHSDTTIQGTCTYNLLLLFGHWSLRPSPCTVRRWPGELEIFKRRHTCTCTPHYFSDTSTEMHHYDQLYESSIAVCDSWTIAVCLYRHGVAQSMSSLVYQVRSHLSPTSSDICYT